MNALALLDTVGDSLKVRLLVNLIKHFLVHVGHNKHYVSVKCNTVCKEHLARSCRRRKWVHWRVLALVLIIIHSLFSRGHFAQWCKNSEKISRLGCFLSSDNDVRKGVIMFSQSLFHLWLLSQKHIKNRTKLKLLSLVFEGLIELNCLTHLRQEVWLSL